MPAGLRGMWMVWDEVAEMEFPSLWAQESPATGSEVFVVLWTVCFLRADSQNPSGL